jgi:hypothetical protein
MPGATRPRQPTVTGPTRPRGRAPITTRVPDTHTGTLRRRRPISFGFHQLFEYFFAVALAVLSVHLGGSGVLLTAAIVLGLLALTARGPFGVVRICGSRLHAVLDVVAGLLLALSPLVRALRPGLLGIVAVEVVAVAWLRVTMLTRYAARADSPGVIVPVADSAVADSAVADSAGAAGTESAGAQVSPAMDVGPGNGEATSGATLSAVRVLGRMTARARKRLPETRTTLDSGARRMGASAGRVQRAWRRTTR